MSHTTRAGASRVRLTLLALAAVCFSSVALRFQYAPEEGTEQYAPEHMVKAVTYWASSNPQTWLVDGQFEKMDADFTSYLHDGFNSIIVVVPWPDIQISVDPIKYDERMFNRLTSVFDKARDHGLKVFARVSYPIGLNPANDPPAPDRCHLIMTEEGPDIKLANKVRVAWSHYLERLQELFGRPEYKDTYQYSFFSWEDFFCIFGYRLIEDWETKLATSSRIGFVSFVRKRKNAPDMQVQIPRGPREDHFWDYMDFMDQKWWGLILEGRKVHPALTYEVRADPEWNPKTGLDVHFDMHCNDGGPVRQGFWGRDYLTDLAHKRNGTLEGPTMKPEEAMWSLTHSLKKGSDDGMSRFILG